MAKHRKTRQEKMVADQRHILYHLETTSAQESPRLEKKTELSSNFIPQTPSASTNVFPYAYVAKDLKKTALITSTILFAQILIYFILNRF